MKLSSFPFTLPVLTLVVVVGVCAACRQTKPLPPRYFVNSEQEANELGRPYTLSIAGTGSMKPYIPDSDDPSEVVAIASVEHPAYEALTEGDLVVYRSKNNHFVIHQIVARLGASWISSGINNRHHDGPAVNRNTYQCRVKSVYILPKASRRNARTLDVAFLASPEHTSGATIEGAKLASLSSKPPLRTRRALRP